MILYIYKKMRERGLDFSFCTAEVLDVLSHEVNLAHEILQRVVVRTALKSTWRAAFIRWRCAREQRWFAACLGALPTHSLLPAVSPPLSFSDTNKLVSQLLQN